MSSPRSSNFLIIFGCVHLRNYSMYLILNFCYHIFIYSIFTWFFLNDFLFLFHNASSFPMSLSTSVMPIWTSWSVHSEFWPQMVYIAHTFATFLVSGCVNQGTWLRLLWGRAEVTPYCVLLTELKEKAGDEPQGERMKPHRIIVDHSQLPPCAAGNFSG